MAIRKSPLDVLPSLRPIHHAWSYDRRRPRWLAPLLFLAVGCGPIARSVKFDQPLANQSPTFKTVGAVAMEPTHLDIDSSMNAAWSGEERQKAGEQVAGEVSTALGPHNVARREQADRLVSLDIRVKEVVHASPAMTALRIIVPAAAGVLAGVLAYKSWSNPCEGHNGPGEICIPDESPRFRNTITMAGSAILLAHLGMSLIPSHDASYYTQATIMVRERLTGAIALHETVYAEHHDRFSNFWLPDKLDGAIGSALRKLEPGITATLATKMPPMAQPFVPPLPAPAFVPAPVPPAPLPTQPTPSSL